MMELAENRLRNALDGTGERTRVRSRDLDGNTTLQWAGLLGAGLLEGASLMGWSARLDGSGK